MSSPENNRFKHLVQQFEQAWFSENRPWIADYVSDVEKDERATVLGELIPIDISFRRKKGETPRPGDYLQLGRQAVAIAIQELHEEFECPDSSRDVNLTTGATPSNFGSAKATVIPESAFDPVSSEFVGPYKLLQQIGEGGMGTVWMAEQMEPVRRRVALKVIRSEIGSKKAIARFEAERQALAMMDHPNIAKVLGAGTTDQGNPYFVMELVNGVQLNKYCDSRKLNLNQRLELMLPVCRAIQHAHQKGIIHRDLKHSNVLVTQNDGVPVPKVIDFGLAKAFQGQHILTDKTMFTEFGKVVGTLQYMSPEQAEMNSVDVDTRSDVYSLGVMIFKLITGGTPLDNQTISTNSFMQVLELIREKEPPRVSVHLKSLDDKQLAKVAKLRSTKPDKLIQQTSSDIDWIVMKTLEKERSRRYQTANGLALDIERFLRNDIVQAAPPSTFYLLNKMYRRNRSAVIASICFATLLFLGIIGTTIGMVWAINERAKADQKTAEAKIESRNASIAEKEARLAETKAESRLHAIRLKSAWSDWQLGNVESAWQMLNSLNDHETGWESQFLKTEFTSSQAVLYGHALRVMTIDASPDGRFVATAGHDNSVKVWNATNHQLVWSELVADAPHQVKFSPDSQSLACVDRSNCITYWDSATGQDRRRHGPFPSDLTSLAFLGDGTRAVIAASQVDQQGVARSLRKIGTADPLLRIVDVADGSVLSEMKGHSSEIVSVDCSRDGKFMVSCDRDSNIHIWQRIDNEVPVEANVRYKLTKTIKSHLPGVAQVCVCPNQPLFVSCGKDSMIRSWSLETGNMIQVFAGHSEPVTGVAFSVSGDRIVSCSSDRKARVWNLDGTELVICQGHFDELNQVCFSPDGSRIYTASDDKTGRVWDASRKTSTLITKPHTNVVWQADFSNDGKRLFSVGEDSTICITDVTTGQSIKTPTKLSGPILTVDHSPTSPQFAAAGTDAVVRIYSSFDGVEVHAFEAHQDYIWDLSFSSDGQMLATACSDGTFKLWNTNDWSLIREVPAHDGELGSVRFSPDDQWIVTAGDDHLVKTWDANTFELVHELVGHRNTVWRAVFSPSGETIVSSSFDGDIIIWDAVEGQGIRAIAAHKNQVAGLAFSPNGKRIVSASDDRTIKIWDIETGIELFVLRDKDDSAIVHVSFSNDGSKLVSGNQEGWVTIRSAQDFSADFQPFLPQNAVELMIDGIQEVTSSTADAAVFQDQLAIAENCSAHFPSYQSYTVQGIAQYRLGRWAEAVKSLTEAGRIEPIEYGETDLFPNIEAYLVLSHLKLGQHREAGEARMMFAEKAAKGPWNNDSDMRRLQQEIDEAFAKATQLPTP